MFLKQENIRQAVIGGALLGGGGGGAIELGMQLGFEALKQGEVVLKDIEEVSPSDLLVTCSLVGAPASTDTYIEPGHYIEAIDYLQLQTELGISGVVSNECGAVGCVNGWLQSSIKGLFLVDAPCNGRAHPTGLMGSMGLHRDKDYISSLAFSGGDPKKNRHIVGFCKGSIENTAQIARYGSILAGGMVAVSRNPVESSFLRKNGAPGAIKKALEIGRAMLLRESEGPEAMVSAAMEILGGEVICKGIADGVKKENQGGFDVGKMMIKGYEVTFCNEYTTLENFEGERIATFPDLIMTVDALTGIPVTTADLCSGQEVFLLKTTASNLILGSGMFCEELFEPIEIAVGKKLK